MAAAGMVGLTIGGLLRAEYRQKGALARNIVSLIVVGCISFLMYSILLPQYMAFSAGPAWKIQNHSTVQEIVSGGFVGILPWWCVAPFGAAILLGAGREKSASAAVASSAVLVAILIILTGAWRAQRFFVSAWSLAWVPMARGVVEASRRMVVQWLLLCAMMVVTLVSYVQFYRLGKPDYRTAAKILQERMEPGERLGLISDGRPMEAYLKNPPPILAEDLLMESNPDWFLVLDKDLGKRPALTAWVKWNYEIQFQLPSMNGSINAYRKRAG